MKELEAKNKGKKKKKGGRHFTTKNANSKKGKRNTLPTIPIPPLKRYIFCYLTLLHKLNMV